MNLSVLILSAILCHLVSWHLFRYSFIAILEDTYPLYPSFLFDELSFCFWLTNRNSHSLGQPIFSPSPPAQVCNVSPRWKKRVVRKFLSLLIFDVYMLWTRFFPWKTLIYSSQPLKTNSYTSFPSPVPLAIMMSISSNIYNLYKTFTWYSCFLIQNFLYTSKDESSQLKAIDFGLSDFVKPGLFSFFPA